MSPLEPPPRLLVDVAQDAIVATGDELSASAVDPSSNFDLRNGRYVGRAGNDLLWSFDCDVELPVRPETPGLLTTPDRDELPCTLVAMGEFDLVIGVGDELGETVRGARLSLNPWFILDSLRTRLNQLVDDTVDVALAEQLLDMADLDETAPPELAVPDAIGDSLGEDQRRAIDHATAGGLRFVWGPPGTGKTATLAGTVHALVTAGKRVLVLAHSNAAVDVAMVRVAEQLANEPALLEDRVLRVGTPHLPAARACAQILPDEIIRARFPDLLERRDELSARRTDLSTRMKAPMAPKERDRLARELHDVREGIAELEERLSQLRVELVLQAEVIGATLSKVALDDLIWNWDVDAVIVDEASMAGLPFLLALALRGAESLICFGDFRQLPPVAVSDRDNAKRWFARDVFELSGVVERQENDIPDPRVSILRRQYRMGTHIAETVSQLAYFGLLETDPAAAAAAEAIAAHQPEGGNELCVVDTSGLSTVAQRDVAVGSFSRFSPVSAALVSSIAEDVVAQGLDSIGVITPYRAQSKLLQALLRDNESVTVGTVHKFQGSERDCIIVDLVDAVPQTGPSRLTGGDPDTALRLLNIALSRARGKVIVVADLGFVYDQYPTITPLRSVLDLVSDQGGVRIPARELLSATDAVEWVSSWRSTPSWDEDLASTSVIDINIPSDEHASLWLYDLMEIGSNPETRVKLNAPFSVAREFEESDSEITLQSLGNLPMIRGDGTWTYAGTRDPSAPACMVRSEAFAAALASLVTGRS